MNRFLIINPALNWIQGDIIATSAREAVQRLESRLSFATENETWEVYEAPAGFPADGASYQGGDESLVAAVRASGTSRMFDNARFEQAPAYAIAC